jgi:hypothetical protein
MDSDGTRDARGTHANPVPRPAGPPDVPGAASARGAASRRRVCPSAVADWLNEPRPEAKPGIWRFGYRLPKGRGGGRLSPVTVVGILVPLVVGSCCGRCGGAAAMPYQFTLLKLFTPDDWWWGGTVASQDHGGRRGRPRLRRRVLRSSSTSWGGWAAGRTSPGTSSRRRPQPARALLALLGRSVTLSFVFPDAFPGVSWDALPVVDAVFALVALISGGFDVFGSTVFKFGLYTVITLLVVWPFARIGGWLPLREGAARRS